jgi:hypothetical protein
MTNFNRQSLDQRPPALNHSEKIGLSAPECKNKAAKIAKVQ